MLSHGNWIERGTNWQHEGEGTVKLPHLAPLLSHGWAQLPYAEGSLPSSLFKFMLPIVRRAGVRYGPKGGIEQLFVAT